MDGLGGSINRFYNTIRSSTAPPQQVSAVETIQKLCETLGNAPQLEDRRAALLGLKGLSRDWKAEVGQATIPLLLTVLETDAQEDVEMAKTVLETLNVLSENDEAAPSKSSRDTPPGLRNTDRFLSTDKPFHALLSLLRQPHFYVRYFCLQLFATLLSNRPEIAQRYTLNAPGGVGRLVEVLDDTRDLIRNEGLLLLISLSSSNTDIQKIVAFEGVFDKLFHIIDNEGGIVAGGVVVQDCLTALVGLLRFNVSNQNFFREASCISRIAPLLLFPSSNQIDDHSLGEFAIQFWPDQKIANVELILTVVRMLVSGAGDGRKVNQKTLLATSVTRCLIELSLASNAPSSIKSTGLHALAEILRDSSPNQELFTNLRLSPLIPSSYDDSEQHNNDPDAEVQWERAQPVPAILALVAMAIEGDPGLGINATTSRGLSCRAAAVTMFESYVSNLPDVRVDILSSMTPPKQTVPSSSSHHTAGTILLSGLRSFPASSSSPFDSHASFFSCILLTHLLKNTESCKRLAREITFSMSQDDGTPANESSKGLGSNSNNKDNNNSADDEENENDDIGLVSIVVGNLMFAQREYGTPAGQTMSDDWSRIMVGYILLLSVWMWESPKTVKVFLSEGTNLEVLVRPILQSTGVDSLVQGLSAFLLGIVYEYNREPGSSITREKLHHFLRTRVDADQFVSRIHRLRDDPRFKNIGPDIFEIYDEESANEGFWFDWAFAEFLKNNYLAAQRAILLEPNAPEGSRLSMDDSETAELVSSLRSSLATSSREVETFKQRITTLESERNNAVSEKQKLSEENVQIKEKLEQLQNVSTAKESSQSENEQGLKKQVDDLIMVKESKDRDLEQLGKEKTQLEEELEKIRKDKDDEISTLQTKQTKDSENSSNQEREIEELKKQNDSLKVKQKESEKEQEDLLVLLEEISNKRKSDRKRMREAQLEVSEDEDEDE